MISFQPEQLPVERVVHCDWSIDPDKRWMCRANWNGSTYVVEVPQQVGDLGSFVTSIREGLHEQSRLLLGFDFPVGVPAAFARRAEVNAFLELLPLLGADRWDEFYHVCEFREEISLQRPFYPYRPGGTSRDHLVQGLGLGHRDELLRTCEHATWHRNAACPLFWTLGGNQVGRAAIAGWQNILAPALCSETGTGFWPFQGSLREVLARYPTVIAETYPGEAYGHLGFPRNWKGKRDQAKRCQRSRDLRDWASGRSVDLVGALTEQIDDGFGPGKGGEDPFDAVVGEFSLIDVILGQRAEGEPPEEHRKIEGWILGQ